MLRSSGRVPRDVKKSLDLHRSERVLVAAPDPTGRWVIGTDQALHVPADQAYERIAWDRIEHAEWDKEAEVLRISMLASTGEAVPAQVLRFEPNAATERLLGHVRERVTASVVIDRHLPERGVRVVGRRAADGEVVWTLVFDHDVDPGDPAVRSVADAALAEIRDEVGL